MRLRFLLQENEAAEEAHRLGLVSGGWGKWNDKNGNTVAITKNGKLVPVNKDQMATQNQQPKAEPVKHTPSTMSKAQAGNEPKNKIPDTQADRDKAKEKNDKQMGGGEELPPVVEPNIFSPVGKEDPMRSVRTLTNHEIKKEFKHWADPNKLLETIVPGEKVEILNNQDEYEQLFYNNSIGASPDIDRYHMENKVADYAADDANEQGYWRKKLPVQAQLNLMKFQEWWQDSRGQWFASPQKKIHNNALLNSVCEENPPICNLPGPIRRGMRIKTDKIKQYLSEFAIGKDIDMPPSGFSAGASHGFSIKAENFAANNPKMGKLIVGVLLRLSPNKSGQIYGLHLNSVQPPQEASKEDRERFNSIMWEYTDEQEIVRYSGPKARVTDVKKIFVKGNVIKNDDGSIKDQDVAVTYIIDLEEQGFESKQRNEAYSNMDSWDKKRKNPVFEQEMNSKFNQAGKTAAEQAHELGWTSKGGAYWMDKDGNTVGKTVNDTLVKIVSKDVTKTDYLKTKTGNQKGTNAGGFYTGEDDVKRYIKFYNDPSQAYCEKLTSTLYRALNLGAPKTAVFKKDGKTALASDIMDGFINKNLGFDKQLANKILDGVAADILTANWDAVGLEDDNILITPNGEVNRIDNGGSLLFRAMGGRKPNQLLDAIPEFSGFSDSAINPAYAKMMNKAGYKSIADMGERFVDQVKNLIQLREKVGGWDKFVEDTIPSMDQKDKMQVVQMLNSRYALLLKKASELQGTSMQQESSDPYGGESPFYKDLPGKQKENPEMQRYLKTKGVK